MTTLSVNFSDATIKRHLSDKNVRQLKDPRYPLRLRFNSERSRASWFVIKYSQGRTIWRKLGNWPHLTTKALINRLPDIQAELAVNLDSSKLINEEFSTLGDLLEWYLRRALKDRNLSKTRKACIKSVITKHLIPLVGTLQQSSITKRQIDELMIWPLQEQYAIGHVRSIWVVLKQVLKQAHKLNMIASNPLADYQFSDFIHCPIIPKPSAIRSDEMAALLAGFRNKNSEQTMLALMMLLHGTRIGETRRASWKNINLSERKWFIPAEHTKTNQSHRLYLTEQAVLLLRQFRERQIKEGYNGAFLFPNTRKRTAISESKANQWIKQISKGEWTSHSLRKVARTVWADLGIDYMVGEMLLNHALSKLDKTYIHTYAERQTKEALETYHDWLSNQGLNFFIQQHDRDNQIV